MMALAAYILVMLITSHTQNKRTIKTNLYKLKLMDGNNDVLKRSIAILSHFVTEFSKCHKMSQIFGQSNFVTESHHVTGDPFSDILKHGFLIKILKLKLQYDTVNLLEYHITSLDLNRF